MAMACTCLPVPSLAGLWPGCCSVESSFLTAAIAPRHPGSTCLGPHIPPAPLTTGPAASRGHSPGSPGVPRSFQTARGGGNGVSHALGSLQVPSSGPGPSPRMSAQQPQCPVPRHGQESRGWEQPCGPGLSCEGCVGKPHPLASLPPGAPAGHVQAGQCLSATWSSPETDGSTMSGRREGPAPGERAELGGAERTPAQGEASCVGRPSSPAVAQATGQTLGTGSNPGRGTARSQAQMQAPRLPVGTHVDDGIRLDVVHVGVPQAQLLAIPLGAADDACGHRVLQGEGAADGHHELARPQVCRVAQQQHRELFLGRGSSEPDPGGMGPGQPYGGQGEANQVPVWPGPRGPHLCQRPGSKLAAVTAAAPPAARLTLGWILMVAMSDFLSMSLMVAS